jgi:hypothetical protein
MHKYRKAKKVHSVPLSIQKERRPEGRNCTNMKVRQRQTTGKKHMASDREILSRSMSKPATM